MPFDPRGGRLTRVTGELAGIVGHPILLELDTALSPELKVTLEESVLKSFETIVKEMVYLMKEDQEMFARAREIRYIVAKYDAVAEYSEGEVSEDGTELRVTSPPDRFPVLERGVLTQAVYRAGVAELDQRWGNVDPPQLSAGQLDGYFAYMTTTRPGAGYIWVAERAKKAGNAGSNWEANRVEHFRRMLQLSAAAARAQNADVARKLRHWLASSASYGLGTSALQSDYGSWLSKNAGQLADEDRLTLAKVVFEEKKDARPAGFDRFAWGLSIYDQWAAGRVKGELEKQVICPAKRRGEAETEIKYGCSAFFSTTFADDHDRNALRDAVLARSGQDAARLQEVALLNIGYGHGKQAVAYVDALGAAKRTDLFVDGVRLLFHDYARRDDVKGALDDVKDRWWRDYPSQRGLTLLVMARRWEQLHVHYADNQWTTFQKEFGGPVKKEVLGQFIAEGPRAVEMIPRMWLAFAKNQDRDEQVAKSLKVILERDRTERTSRSTAVLTMLRMRLCSEKNAAGLGAMRSAIEAWASEHQDSRAMVSNALADFTLARCPRDPDADPER